MGLLLHAELAAQQRSKSMRQISVEFATTISAALKSAAKMKSSGMPNAGPAVAAAIPARGTRSANN